MKDGIGIKPHAAFVIAFSNNNDKPSAEVRVFANECIIYWEY